MKFSESDYPALFLAGDRASVSARQQYLNLTRGMLILLVAAAGLAAISSALDAARSAFAITSAILLAASILLTTYLRASNIEKLWYGGRAIAESVKSMTWRYMMGADPYFVDLPPLEADKRFVAGLASIARERKQLAFGFGGEFSEQPQISKAMRSTRSAALEERKCIYIVERVCSQRSWYGKEARSNRIAERTYFILILVGQFLAFVAAIVLVGHPESKVKLTGLFVSLASAFIAWLQLKQHRELAQSYSVTELDLGLVHEQAQYVTNDRELSDFVGDAENAISREHTLWIARRDRP